jgi:hypothetical protein
MKHHLRRSVSFKLIQTFDRFTIFSDPNERPFQFQMDADQSLISQDNQRAFSDKGGRRAKRIIPFLPNKSESGLW